MPWLGSLMPSITRALYRYSRSSKVVKVALGIRPQCTIEAAPEILVPGALSKGNNNAHAAVDAKTTAEQINGSDCCLARRVPASTGATIPALEKRVK